MSYLSHHHRSRAPLGRVGATVLATALAATAVALTGAPAEATPTSATTLTVNAAQNLRPVTHVGTGSLYGLANATTPADSVVQALKPNTFVQMAPGGSQLPNGEPAPAGDALVVAPKAAAAGRRWSYGCRTGIRTSLTSG